MTQTFVGTPGDDLISGTPGDDLLIGQGGDDTVTGTAGDDVIIGDYLPDNMLTGTEDALSFAQFAENGAWTLTDLGNGHSAMTQSVQTVTDGAYSITFEAAANIGEGHLSGTIEVLWNGEVIDTINTAEAGFESHTLNLIGTGGQDQLTFRSVESTAQSDGPVINTDGPVFYYEKEMEIGGQTVTVKAVAPGQPNLYQVMNGTLNVFDVETETYQQAGSDATVVINGFGFNQEDDLFYGIAVKNGVDSLGNVVTKNDIVMMDANGDSYRLGDGPYASWTGDFDDKGNLWSFHSSMDRVTVIDVDQRDADGNPLTTVFKFPKSLVTDSVWDVAFDATTQKFYGVVRPKYEGASAKLMVVDVQDVQDGGVPQFSTYEIDSTLIDGVLHNGAPAITFGAAIVDGDGNLYVGGNGGDHDMNDATGTSGGIYRVILDEATGTARLELVTEAPKAYSNDGAADPRAIDPFTETDPGATVLIRSPELLPVEGGNNSFDDNIHAGGGADTVLGGFGEDEIIGSSSGDTLSGNDGDDMIYGGAGPNSTSTIVSFYDENGLRYDQFGNLLPEDDDILFGGAGQDMLSGSAGHDVLSGESGDDRLFGGSGNDQLFGGTGDDLLSGGRHADTLSGGDGDDTLNGGSSNDVLDGGDGADNLIGGGGADTITGGLGNDRINGGSGNDTVAGGEGDDRIKSGSGDDSVTGGDGRDYINAHKGDDVVDGGAGNDTIYLGAGADIASGGAGSDRFVFRTQDLDGNTNQILDYARDGSGRDRLDLRQLNLVNNGSSVDDWIAANLSQQQDGDIEIDLGGATILLHDHNDLGQSFMDQVLDGLLL
ncbi:calcium-binding protein [Shimia ponticola]|uniref:calcium-binding protein n=1 Tax=Shimia ponticola TaxID=2582893 RepID=UPI0011BF7632|nr:calcium-binding protein [Shimia ponticola]